MGKKIFLLLGGMTLLLAFSAGFTFSQSQPGRNKTYLPHMSWVDVQDALKYTDMVIIPVGSTEQHGPHNPLCSDWLAAEEIAKRVAAKTGVIVAPVLSVGYSPHHMGFPGTITISAETMERVLFEAAQSLIQHGFMKIMFLNRHGGNKFIITTVIKKINHETSATAVNIGLGSEIHKGQGAFFDWHSGESETSWLLYLAPQLVNMERAEKPTITLPPKLQKIADQRQQQPALMMVFNAELGAPAASGKHTASHEMSSNGTWTFGDPKKAAAERGKKEVGQYVEEIVQFIEAWRRLESSE